MAPDLLSTIGREIDERLNELRPLLAEHEQLLVAADALVTRAMRSSLWSRPPRVTRATRRAGSAKASWLGRAGDRACGSGSGQDRHQRSG